MRNVLSNASSVDQDVHFTEVIDDVLDALRDSVLVANVHRVEANVNASLLGELLGGIDTIRWVDIHDRNPANASLSERLRHHDIQTKDDGRTVSFADPWNNAITAAAC